MIPALQMMASSGGPARSVAAQARTEAGSASSQAIAVVRPRDRTAGSLCFLESACRTDDVRSAQREHPQRLHPKTGITSGHENGTSRQRQARRHLLGAGDVAEPEGATGARVVRKATWAPLRVMAQACAQPQVYSGHPDRDRIVSGTAQRGKPLPQELHMANPTQAMPKRRLGHPGPVRLGIGGSAAWA